MSAHRLVTSFWDAAVPPAGMEDSIAQFRQLVYDTQYPQHCESTCSMSRRLPVSGAMQNMRRRALALLQAVTRKCTFVPAWPKERYSAMATSPRLRDACDRQNRSGIDCYFLPVSNCTERGTTLISNWNVTKGLDVVAQWTGLRSEALVMGTLLAWLMRPQEDLRAALRWYGASLGLVNHQGYRGARHRRIAMHLRRGDKYSLHTKHMRNHSWRIHPDSFAMWGRRVAANIGAERVLYMTDDRSIDLAKRSGPLFQLVPGPHACSPSSHIAMNMGELKRRPPTTTAYRHIIQQGGTWSSRMHELATAHASLCGSEAWLDDGIQFFAGVLLLAQCSAFIGLQISNVGMAVVELMATQRHPPPFFDVLNDVARGPFLSDERIWINGVHNPASLRAIEEERLYNGDGTYQSGCWSCTGLPAVLPTETREVARSSSSSPMLSRSQVLSDLINQTDES